MPGPKNTDATCWKSLSKSKGKRLLVRVTAAIAYPKAVTLAGKRTLPGLQSVSVFTKLIKVNMNVYIDNINLTPKQIDALRVAIKARYTPARVKALNAKIRAAEGK